MYLHNLQPQPWYVLLNQGRRNLEGRGAITSRLGQTSWPYSNQRGEEHIMSFILLLAQPEFLDLPTALVSVLQI